MRIRRASKRDAATILKTDHLCRIDPARRRFIRNAIHQNDVFVIENKRQALGFAVVKNGFLGRPFLELLYIREDMRRLGFGQALLAYLENRILLKADLWTSTNQSNRPMRQLLRQRGYQTAGTLVGLDAGDPEVFYYKPICHGPTQPILPRLQYSRFAI